MEFSGMRKSFKGVVGASAQDVKKKGKIRIGTSGSRKSFDAMILGSSVLFSSFFASSPAHAAGDCGPTNGGVAPCTSTGDLLLDGIGYSSAKMDVAGADAQAPGALAMPTNINAPVIVVQPPGTTPVNVTTTMTASTAGAGNSAILVGNLGSGATTVTVNNDATADGAATPTILVQSAAAPQTLTIAPAATITASGANGIGVQVQTAAAAPITVDLNGSVLQTNTTAGGTGVLLQSSAAAPIVFNQAAASTLTANGVSATGLAISTPGAATVNSLGTIRTPGNSTLAVSVEGGGPVAITTNTVTSGGFAIFGASSTSVSLTTNGATNATGRAIQAVGGGATGDVTVVTNGAITIANDGFGGPTVGIIAAQQNPASTGAIRVTTNAAINAASTTATSAVGISGTTLGTGPMAVMVNGNITATASGGGAVSGVNLQTGAGAVSITQAAASTVTASGGGVGTNAVSGLQAASATGAVTINSAGNVVLNNGGIEQSAAILAQTGTGAVTINQTGSVTANGANAFGIGVLRSGAGTSTITATNVTATTPNFGFGIGVQGGTANITLAQGGTVNGGGAGVLLLGTGASTVTNNGTLRALSNVAIDASNAAGALMVANAASGTIIGSVNLSALGDTVTNTGTFTAQGLNSNFGAGTDSFANSGLVRFGAAAAPVSIAFQNLETFANLGTGTIDLRQGAAGNVLSMPGTVYNGASGSRLLVNTFLGGAGSVSDRLVVGAVTGTTTIVVTDTNPGAGAYNPTGILVVSATSAPVGAFTIVQPIRKGLWDYVLQRNAAGTEFRLASAPGVGAYELALLPAALRDMWHQSIAPYAERLSEVSEDGPSSAKTSLWLRSTVASGNRDVAAVAPLAVSGGTTAPYDLESHQATYGISAGIDRTVLSGVGQLSFGAGGGWVTNRTRFGASGDRFKTNGGSVTGYIGWAGRSLFATFAAQGVFTSTDIGLTGVPSDKTKAQSIGARLATGYRRGLKGGFYLEPQVSLAYVRTSIDGLVIGSTGVVFADIDSWRGRVTVRAGKLFASAGAEREFGTTPGAAFLSGPGFLVPDNGRFTSGVFGAGLEATNLKRGISAFVRGDYTGLKRDQWQGASVRVGLRIPFGGGVR
jgi:Autotransporter beta-domain